MEDRLRFAPLVRVSTEKQAKRGESLKTQKKQLESIINSFKGKIYKWYSGQEHATAGHERIILKSLMRDAMEKKFDAVIVTDLSRWSRDNGESKRYLGILKEHGIRFFVGTKEMNLNDPRDYFFVGVSVEVAELFGGEHVQRSIDNRVERAKRGCPTSGKLPWGRTFNKKTEKWEILPGSKERINEIAKLYLEKNISFEALGEQYGMNGANLHKLLTKRCGDTWDIEFSNKRLKTKEKVTINIPRLLSESTIKRIREKCEARRTWEHGACKYNYLFSRMIFDKDTGKALTGTSNQIGVRYYRPFHGKRYRYMINANIIEQAVMDELFEALGNNHVLLDAVFEGGSQSQNTDVLSDKIAKCVKEKEQIEKKITVLHNQFVKLEHDNMPKFLEHMSSTIKDFEKKRSQLIFQINLLENQLECTITTAEEVESMRKSTLSSIARLTEIDYFRAGLVLGDLPFEDKQKIVRMIFGGKDGSGKRYGIYIKPSEGTPKRYIFEACGKIGTIYGCVNSHTGKYESEDPYDLIRHSQDDLLKDILTIVKNPNISSNHHDYENKSTSSCYLPAQGLPLCCFPAGIPPPGA